MGEQITGAPSSAYAPRSFFIISLDAVRCLGSWEAAACFQRICWRAERTGSWRGTMQEIADEIGVSARTAKRITQRLRDLGWVRADRSSSWDPTLIWTPIFAGDAPPPDAPSRVTPVAPTEGADEAPSSFETGEETTDPSDAAAPRDPGSSLRGCSTRSESAERGTMTTARDRQPVDADLAFEGMPEPPPKETAPSAGELVAAWCRGWSEAHGGATPHTSVVKRVAGICRNVAKDCSRLEEWQDAWRACLAAGRAGRYDVVSQLAAPAPLGKGNHYLTLARNPDRLRTSGLLGSMLAQPLEGPRAIGDAS